MKKTIMIIDDQASTRKLLSNFLGNYFDVVEFENAKAALTSMQSGKAPHLIVADILMPEMTGMDLLRSLQEAKIETQPPVIVLSSVENSSEKLKCFQLGARDYMVKPFNPEELRMRITNLLAN
ncbi:MAG: response regulator [Bacteroidetes bacterium]|nr:response regulator [Bacteroidota bacterium]